MLGKLRRERGLPTFSDRTSFSDYTGPVATGEMGIPDLVIFDVIPSP